MRGKVIEFKTILGFIESPYQRGDLFFAKFSSKDVLESLNKADEKIFMCAIHWEICFGKKIYKDKVLPLEMFKAKPVITSGTVKKLKNAWSESLKSEESEEERFELMDLFINAHCVSKYQIELYLLEQERLNPPTE